jgi:calcium/calmodulin-dependent protein kinase I
MLRKPSKYIIRLLEEVKVFRELRGHNNVIQSFDMFRINNEMFVIMELGWGGDLLHLLMTHPKHRVMEAYAGELVPHPTLCAHIVLSRYLDSPIRPIFQL